MSVTILKRKIHSMSFIYHTDIQINRHRFPLCFPSTYASIQILYVCPPIENHSSSNFICLLMCHIHTHIVRAKSKKILIFPFSLLLCLNNTQTCRARKHLLRNDVLTKVTIPGWPRICRQIFTTASVPALQYMAKTAKIG